VSAGWGTACADATSASGGHIMKAARSVSAFPWRGGRSPLGSGVRATGMKGRERADQKALVPEHAQVTRPRRLARQPHKPFWPPARITQGGKQIP
jgi:hypothetical protein